jgi:hypothetical protein
MYTTLWIYTHIHLSISVWRVTFWKQHLERWSPPPCKYSLTPERMLSLALRGISACTVRISPRKRSFSSNFVTPEIVEIVKRCGPSKVDSSHRASIDALRIVSEPYQVSEWACAIASNIPTLDLCDVTSSCGVTSKVKFTLIVLSSLWSWRIEFEKKLRHYKRIYHEERWKTCALESRNACKGVVTTKHDVSKNETLD